MITVVTGTVGVEKKKYLQAVVDLAQQEGKKVTLFNIGDMMYAEAPDIAPGRILDISRERLHLLRRSIIKDIIGRSKKDEHIIINTHATFRWRHGLFPAFDFDQMRRLDADMYICMLDSVDAVHARLIHEHYNDHTLKDILVWREEEILATEMMCKGSTPGAKNYLLAIGNEQPTVDTFYKLMFENHQKKTYLSFPMTHVMDVPDVLGRINRFREKMKTAFVCFDPGDLEEFALPFYAQHNAVGDARTIPLNVLGQEVEFSVDELRQIEPDINRQIYARDFAMIDQADMIISFIPPMPDGKAAISSGVERELQHAYEQAKEVYVIWTAQSAPSVFVSQTATRVFREVDEAERFFVDKGYYCAATCGAEHTEISEE